MTGRAKRKLKSIQEPGKREAKKARCDDVKATPPSAVSPQQREETLQLCKLHMPEDLYHFWDLCKELCPENPCGALKDTLGLQLVGPFDILAGAHRNCKNPSPNFHLHWRYFYDPPEFQTILRGSEESQHHIGYYRDIPDSLPAFVGENEAKSGCTITQMGDNVFAAVLIFLMRKKNKKGSQKTGDLKILEAKLRERSETLNLSLEQKTKEMKQRDKKLLSKRSARPSPTPGMTRSASERSNPSRRSSRLFSLPMTSVTTAWAMSSEWTSSPLGPITSTRW
ncbi:histone PARylation factor 1 isoform X2 [Nerophis ophidion]|uniref:histone PARylation factor 1 isoform X2 n=1 Tax=Nerophis ophidion TaxID=159077 RepID=UPI002AE028FE|nr:histone PARylation factor 1 isoform X2 [Nerophis ophidion]